MTRPFLAVLALVTLLAACGAPPELPRTVEPIGDFRLGYNIVVSTGATQAPASRPADEDELDTALRAAMEERLGRYDGAGLYHVGLKVEGYSLGRAGIPILFSPRSVLLIAMNVWDDATQTKLTEEPVRITAFENATGPFTGSGLIKSKDEQLASLAFSAAREVEEYLQSQEEAWFAPKPDRTRMEFIRDPVTGLALQMPEDGAGAAGEAAGDAAGDAADTPVTN